MTLTAYCADRVTRGWTKSMGDPEKFGAQEL